MLYFWDIGDNEAVPSTVVPEMTFKDQSRSSAVSSFIRSPGISIRVRKSTLLLFLAHHLISINIIIMCF